MSYFNELYQEVILDHNKRPRNFGELPGADCQAHGNNPLCGDRLTVYLKLDGNTVTDDHDGDAQGKDSRRD
jgi:nitrogen fixation NifU-like protein